jgi:hypothetical protein
VTTIYVSDVLKDAFPFLSDYIDESHSEIRKIISKISFDAKTDKIIDIYSSKAMGTLVYALANLTFSSISKRNPSDEENKLILGVSLVSLSSSLFDDALDSNMKRSRRAYLVAIADLCTSLGFTTISQAKVDPKIKSEITDIVQKFQIKSWKANLQDQINKWPTVRSCETSLDAIGLPLEAGTRIGAMLASGDQEYYADLGRTIGQAVALLDDILDLEEDPLIKELLENHQVKEALLRLKHTSTIQKCKLLLEEKLSKLEKYGLDIHLKSKVSV